MPRYKFIDFLRTAEIVIWPDLQTRARNPFNMSVAKQFFNNFVGATFEFDGPVGSILIKEDENAMPSRSFAVPPQLKNEEVSPKR